MSAPTIRVVKVGGSLLDLPDLLERLRSWLDAQSAAHHVLVAGGGPLVDQVRKWNSQRALDETSAHWLCIDLMTVTAELLHGWIPETPLVVDHKVLAQRTRQPGVTIFEPAQWLRTVEPSLAGDALPPTWGTTSDAIAGRLAAALAAKELVLLKSRLPPDDVARNFSALAATGYVDQTLARIARQLPPTRVVDLRGDLPRESVVLLPGS